MNRISTQGSKSAWPFATDFLECPPFLCAPRSVNCERVLNAVTEFIDHHKDLKGKSRLSYALCSPVRQNGPENPHAQTDSRERCGSLNSSADLIANSVRRESPHAGCRCGLQTANGRNGKQRNDP